MKLKMPVDNAAKLYSNKVRNQWTAEANEFAPTNASLATAAHQVADNISSLKDDRYVDVEEALRGVKQHNYQYRGEQGKNELQAQQALVDALSPLEAAPVSAPEAPDALAFASIKDPVSISELLTQYWRQADDIKRLAQTAPASTDGSTQEISREHLIKLLPLFNARNDPAKLAELNKEMDVFLTKDQLELAIKILGNNFPMSCDVYPNELKMSEWVEVARQGSVVLNLDFDFSYEKSDDVGYKPHIPSEDLQSTTVFYYARTFPRRVIFDIPEAGNNAQIRLWEVDEDGKLSLADKTGRSASSLPVEPGKKYLLTVAEDADGEGPEPLKISSSVLFDVPAIKTSPESQEVPIQINRQNAPQSS
ncbi:MAG: hypothetical protein R3C68_01270 [Myxococcota bacterium]